VVALSGTGQGDSLVSSASFLVCLGRDCGARSGYRGAWAEELPVSGEGLLVQDDRSTGRGSRPFGMRHARERGVEQAFFQIMSARRL
jgi:hypothetical protein